MPKFRTDKSRKKNLENFKQSKSNKTKTNTMSQQPPKMRPFRQVPVWQDEAEFVITGEEFDILQQYFNTYVPPVRAVESIFKRAIDKGIVSFKYVDNDGNEVPKEEVQDYLKQVAAYLQSQKAEQAESSEATDVTDVTPDAEPQVKKLKKPEAKVISMDTEAKESEA